MPAKISSNATLTLSVKNLGHVPSFKNSKEIIPGKNGRRSMLITKPERQKWMEECVKSLEYQLNLKFQTTGGVTLTEPCQQYLIALLGRLRGFDDSVQWVSELIVKVENVEKGFEGADIFIDEIDNTIESITL